MPNPKVSVVIPAYNEEKYIENTLKAVLAQDYSDFEVIVVNNASSDKTREILSRFSDPKIKIVDEPRKGLLFAREAGRKKSTGEIIAQLDADCLPRKNWISNGVKLIEDKNVVGASGPYIFYDYNKILVALTLFGQVFFYFVNLFSQITKKGAVLIGGSSFVKSYVLEKIGGYNTNIDFWGEDSDTAKRVAQHGWIKYSWKISLQTSARRFKKEGFLKLIYLYFKNFFVIISGKNLASKEINHPR